MPKSNVPKTYVRPDNTAVLTCSHCGAQKVILADTFQGYKHRLKVKCSCNEVFIVNLEFRNRIRRRTHLRGTYINHSQDDKNGHLIVKDVSVSGLSFTSLDIESVKVGDELKVDFTLDDEYQTEVSKELIVKNIRNKVAGCKFVTPEDVFGSHLGHYITQSI